MKTTRSTKYYLLLVIVINCYTTLQFSELINCLLPVSSWLFAILTVYILPETTGNLFNLFFTEIGSKLSDKRVVFSGKINMFV